MFSHLVTWMSVTSNAWLPAERACRCIRETIISLRRIDDEDFFALAACDDQSGDQTMISLVLGLVK